MSGRRFNPTAEQRGNVEAMIGFGIPETEICLLIKNPATGKPINLATFRKYFAAEIATGAAKVKSLVGNCIVASILGREGGLCSAAIWMGRRVLILFVAQQVSQTSGRERGWPCCLPRLGWAGQRPQPSSSQTRVVSRSFGRLTLKTPSFRCADCEFALDASY